MLGLEMNMAEQSCGQAKDIWMKKPPKKKRGNVYSMT